jgi:arabinogalactan oligomer / maltooligosaccharide transport system substrate-binding protein
MGACSEPSDGPARPPPRLRLWHAFSPLETAALNAVLAERRPPVEATLLVFSRAQHIVRDALRAGDDCPDLIRLDATWLPGLARAGYLEPVPSDLATPEFMPPALNLASDRGTAYGLPQSVDGLALLYVRERVAAAGAAWPPHTLGQLMAAARSLTHTRQYGLAARVDGYWFLAFLRASGGDILDPDRGSLGVDAPAAAAALTDFAALFGPSGIAPPPLPPGDEGPATARRFRAGQVAIAVDGPWAVADLRADHQDLAVVPFPLDPAGRAAAPLGGHVYAVPRCARDPAGAWQLALELTAPALQTRWARQLGVVPSTSAALAAADPFTRDFWAALQQARPLPRHPVSAQLFDDLSPAVAAVVAGDATAEEALAGVARAWRRLLAQARPDPRNAAELHKDADQP